MFIQTGRSKLVFAAVLLATVSACGSSSGGVPGPSEEQTDVVGTTGEPTGKAAETPAGSDIDVPVECDLISVAQAEKILGQPVFAVDQRDSECNYYAHNTDGVTDRVVSFERVCGPTAAQAFAQSAGTVVPVAGVPDARLFDQGIAASGYVPAQDGCEMGITAIAAEASVDIASNALRELSAP